FLIPAIFLIMSFNSVVKVLHIRIHMAVFTKKIYTICITGIFQKISTNILEHPIILKSLTFCNAFSFRLLFTNACNTIYVVICAENQRTDQVPYVLIVFIDSCSNPQYLAGTGCFDLTVVKFPV